MTRSKVVGLVKSLPFHLMAILVTFLFLLPLIWMVSVSLRQPGLPPPRTVEWFPSPLTWTNYLRIFQIIPLGRYFLNSLAVVAMAIPLTLLTSSWAGYAMALLGKQERFRLLVFSVGLQMIPITAVWLTRFIIFSWLGLTNSRFALVAPALMGTTPLFILLFYWNFRRLPRETYESARLDGATAFQGWWYLALPLARNTLAAVSMLTFLFYWNDFINPLMYLRSQSLYTLSVGLQQLQEFDKTNWPLLMAAGVVMTTPALIVFLALQRSLLQLQIES